MRYLFGGNPTLNKKKIPHNKTLKIGTDRCACLEGCKEKLCSNNFTVTETIDFRCCKQLSHVSICTCTPSSGEDAVLEQHCLPKTGLHPVSCPNRLCQDTERASECSSYTSIIRNITSVHQTTQQYTFSFSFA